MKTLAETLSFTTPVSTLVRKARRLGVRGVESLIDLAAARGCTHYKRQASQMGPTPARDELSDEELTILLMAGENCYEPTAIRCAAQLARSANVDPLRLSRLAVREKTERVLSHIARAGMEHDPEGSDFWAKILSALPLQPNRSEPDLPHWSRFVSMPGRQRNGIAANRWLTPAT